LSFASSSASSQVKSICLRSRLMTSTQFFRCLPDSPKPDSPNFEKVHSMSKCSCFVEKKSYSVILSRRNIPSMQPFVLLILRHSRLSRKTRESLRASFAGYFRASRLTRECRKISNLIQHTRNVAKAQNYNSRKFGLKM